MAFWLVRHLRCMTQFLPSFYDEVLWVLWFVNSMSPINAVWAHTSALKLLGV